MAKIIGDKGKSTFDPDLAREINEKFEAQKRKQAIEEKLNTKKEPEIITPNTQFNTDDFIQLDIDGLYGNKALISPYELQGFNNLNYNNTHEKLIANGLYMPTPEIFMHFFMKIINAYDNSSKVYDTKGNQLSTQKITDMYKHLTTTYLNIYNVPSREGVWTWLNSKYKKINNILNRELVTGFHEGLLITKTEPLGAFLQNDCFVDLKFNKQGLPTQKSVNQNYEQGKNIKFYSPVDGWVARFVVGSGRASLVCGRNPDNSNPALGVFGCCEATPKNKSKIQKLTLEQRLEFLKE
ncbi:MAG: hypothetical protein PHD81_03055 [Candidatus Nanoarchaeia archaeon]|nr:hypothetical protein [Candidatus Nanoarchaeia archaeon]MDD5588063.1 hypothetical protein [Candidatus Nanoarchaeia archaeon]